MNEKTLQSTESCGPATCESPALERTSQLTTVRPRVDFSEAEDAFVLELDLPGVQPDALEVSFEKHVLTVRGERRASSAMSAEAGVRRREFSELRFERAFQIGEEIDAEGIQAKHEAGVLTLRLPKAKAAARRQIEIRTA